MIKNEAGYIKGFTRVLIIFCALFCTPFWLAAQNEDDPEPPKSFNIFTIAVQPGLFRLNYYDPDFFNNPKFKPGIDLSLQYGVVLFRDWYIKPGIDYVYATGKFITGVDKKNKYINESFFRFPLVLAKKFMIDCNDCFMNPSVFIEFGGYYTTSFYQSTYIQDEPTGLSSLEQRLFFSYQKAGIEGGWGLSFLSNNFGRHVIGIRLYSDQWISANDKPNMFQPSYTSITLFYNLANFTW